MSAGSRKWVCGFRSSDLIPALSVKPSWWEASLIVPVAMWCNTRPLRALLALSTMSSPMQNWHQVQACRKASEECRDGTRASGAPEAVGWSSNFFSSWSAGTLRQRDKAIPNALSSYPNPFSFRSIYGIWRSCCISIGSPIWSRWWILFEKSKWASEAFTSTRECPPDRRTN